MNTAFPKARNIADVRPSAGIVILCLAAFVAACQSPPPVVMAPAAVVATSAVALPPPQAPFDTTPISPVESAGAAAE